MAHPIRKDLLCDNFDVKVLQDDEFMCRQEK